MRGDWLLGFGWSEKNWSSEPALSLQILDHCFPHIPVCFIRADGHAVWVNSKALQRAGIDSRTICPSGGRIEKDQAGEPTGLLVDSAKHLIDSILPPLSREQNKLFAVHALKIFNQAGFSHLRDMSGNFQEFEALHELELSGELTAYIELNYFCEGIKDLAEQLDGLQRASRVPSQKIRNVGIKLFYDGALGSQGALLSQCYCGSSRRGLQLWSLNELEEVFRKTWQLGFSVAIHTIGDEAVDQVAKKVDELNQQGITGVWHLEHVEIARPETIEILKKTQPICHMQPSHWLSDHHWLKQSIGDLAKYSFPWQALELSGIQLCWGSDSPIERPSLELTAKALQESAAAGVLPTRKKWYEYHSHPDASWGADCRTRVDEFFHTSALFDGRPL